MGPPCFHCPCRDRFHYVSIETHLDAQEPKKEGNKTQEQTDCEESKKRGTIIRLTTGFRVTVLGLRFFFKVWGFRVSGFEGFRVIIRGF
jgi:hypothetical protein